MPNTPIQWGSLQATLSEDATGEGYILTLSYEGATPHKVERFTTIEEAKSSVKILNFDWREPNEDDEVDGDVILIGE